MRANWEREERSAYTYLDNGRNATRYPKSSEKAMFHKSVLREDLKRRRILLDLNAANKCLPSKGVGSTHHMPNHIH